MSKSMIAKMLAGSFALIALATSAHAEPSEGKNYGKCSPGYEWSYSLKKCVR